MIVKTKIQSMARAVVVTTAFRASVIFMLKKVVLSIYLSELVNPSLSSAQISQR